MQTKSPSRHSPFGSSSKGDESRELNPERILMRSLPFPYVTVMTYQVGKTCNISSAEEAAENLMMNWPIKTGAQLLAARLACLDALEGKILCSAAREAFIEAAREAGIYMSGSKGSSSHRLLRGRCNTIQGHSAYRIRTIPKPCSLRACGNAQTIRLELFPGIR